MTRHLLIAHGSPDSRHRATMAGLASLVDDRGRPCSVAFLEHDEPSVPTALSELSGHVTTLGMLLAPGYHATVDVPRLLSGAAPSTVVHDRGPLGTGPWLIPTVDRLIADAGGDPSTPVILASAGSSRAAARLTLADFASRWQKGRPGEVTVAVTTGPGLRVEQAAEGLPTDSPTAGIRTSPAVVVPFMIAPGVLADRVTEVAERHGLLTTGTLAESPPFIDALVDRLTA